MAETQASLTTIKSGAAVDMFDAALKKVLANIADTTTDLKARSITIKVAIAPTKDRQLVSFAIDVKAGLRDQAKIEAAGIMSVDDDGNPIVMVREEKQPELPNFSEETPSFKVVEKGA